MRHHMSGNGIGEALGGGIGPRDPERQVLKNAYQRAADVAGAVDVERHHGARERLYEPGGLALWPTDQRRRARARARQHLAQRARDGEWSLSLLFAIRDDLQFATALDRSRDKRRRIIRARQRLKRGPLARREG